MCCKRSNEISQKRYRIVLQVVLLLVEKKWSIHIQLFFEKLVESNLRNQMF